MTIRFSKDWAEAERILSRKDMPSAIGLVIKKDAKHVAEMIRVGLRTQAPGGKRLKPPSRSTMLSRRLAGQRGGQSLVVTRQLMKAIIAKKSGRMKWWVGVKKIKHGNTNTASIASMNEFGFGPIIIKITPKMRRFLSVLFSRTGDAASRGGKRPGYVSIQIPKRPFIQPVLNKEMKGSKARKRLERRFSKATGGDFGR